MCTDSSLKGWSVAFGVWPRQAVARAGRVREKRRFCRRLGAPAGAREAAFAAAGLTGGGPADECSDRCRPGSGHVADSDEQDLSCETEAETNQWIVNYSFPEIDANYLRSKFWRSDISGGWHYEGEIYELETRACLYGVTRAVDFYGSGNCRMLCLGDNMSMVLSIDRHRSKNFVVISLLRRISAYCLARNIKFCIR